VTLEQNAHVTQLHRHCPLPSSLAADGRGQVELTAEFDLFARATDKNIEDTWLGYPLLSINR
jgi:hypothetical protein